MIFWETAFAAEGDIVVAEKANIFLDFLGAAATWAIAIVVFFCFIFLADILKKIAINRIMANSRYEMKEELILLLGRAVYFGALVVGSLIAFNIVGIDIGVIIGFFGLGMGFALKDLLANTIAGVIILTQEKFKIGDLIKIDEKTIGTIIGIDVRTSQVKSIDGTLLIVPNAKFLSNVVQNFSSHPFRRIDLKVSISYDTPIEKAIETTLNSIKKHKSVALEPSSQVIASDFGEYSIELIARFWVGSTDNWIKIKSEVLQQIKTDYEKENINIPFPTRTILERK